MIFYRKQLGTNGFTLIELLVVVAIIGILAAIAVPHFIQAQILSRVARVKSDLHSLCTALESYVVDYDDCPYYYLCDWDSNIVPPFPEYGTHEQNRWELSLLTTPITYISSLPPDIFAPSDNGRWPYDYLSFSALANVSFNMVYAAGVERYMVRSRGPKQQFQGMVLYDPTNGAMSDGDIVRFGSGEAVRDWLLPSF